jgi:peptidoglycan/LPS O-acetylase OafA/YrhL
MSSAFSVRSSDRLPVIDVLRIGAALAILGFHAIHAAGLAKRASAAMAMYAWIELPLWARFSRGPPSPAPAAP